MVQVTPNVIIDVRSWACLTLVMPRLAHFVVLGVTRYITQPGNRQ
jgi:hypothetical protein